jgi:hypothetical protein
LEIPRDSRNGSTASGNDLHLSREERARCKVREE